MSLTIKKTSLMFPGQGAQYKGMGNDLFSRYPELISEVDSMLGYSIQELCANDPDGKLSYTLYTQPCLYVVNHLYFLSGQRSTDYYIGHSLGEYNALCAAGVFDFFSGLKIVQKRAELFAELKDGGMLAVLGGNQDTLPDFIQHHASRIDIANYNSDDQTILSGDPTVLSGIEPLLIQAGFKTIRLNVSGAFHSRYMIPAGEKFASYINQFTFNDPVIPVYSNYNCSLYTKNNTADLLTRQISNPVSWKQQIRLLRQKGVQEFKETGPGNILSRLNSKISDKFPDPKNDVIRLFPLTREHTSALGSNTFKKRYNLSHAYVAGAMFRGVSSARLVIRMANAGLLSFLGTGGLDIHTIDKSIDEIKNTIKDDGPFGINFLHNPIDPAKELELAALCVRKNVSVIEASAFGAATPALVYFRLKGARRATNGDAFLKNHIIAKISRPEVAEIFMSPPPENIVRDLLRKGLLTMEEASCAKAVFLASDITTEADSGGHTDQKAAFTLAPAIRLLRDEQIRKYHYPHKIHIGVAGGIGTPVAAAAAFTLGADYIVTGSINQCTVEAGISDLAKDMLSGMNIQDTAYAPAGDMFELGAKVQVLKRGVLFPARANKLYELYKQYNSLEEIPDDTRKMIEENYFKRSLEEVWSEVESYLASGKPELLNGIRKNPKMKMANVFKYYFFDSARMAIAGHEKGKMDFQIQCGPALGAFNQWVKGTPLEKWQNRHVDQIAFRLMEEAEKVLMNILDEHQKTIAPQSQTIAEFTS